MTAKTPALAALLSGLAFFFSTGLGGSLTPTGLWLLALVAPVPVLWLAFQPATKIWVGALCAFVAMAIGAANILPAYAGSLPVLTLIIAVLAPALAFAAAVTLARYVASRLAPVSGIIAYAAATTALDYLFSMGPNGTAASLAYSQVEAPAMIQIASIFGLWGVTAVMSLFAAAVAMFLIQRKPAFAALALAVLLGNIGYGQWRIATAPDTPKIKVGLAGSDTLIGAGMKDNAASAEAVIKAYGAAVRALSDRGADLIVLPEVLTPLHPEWASTIDSTLVTNKRPMIVAGFDSRQAPRSNVARIYPAHGGAAETYVKRHLVPGLEHAYTPGNASYMTSDRIGVAICKDMDFPETLRADALLEPTVYAVPAWDFDRDAVWHARLAILRGVENGFAVARAAKDGYLTVSDAYGRVISYARTDAPGVVLLRADVARGPGLTLFAVIGDGLAKIAAALSALLLVVAVLAKPKKDAA